MISFIHSLRRKKKLSKLAWTVFIKNKIKLKKKAVIEPFGGGLAGVF